MEFLRRGIPAVLSVMVFKKRVFLVIGGKRFGITMDALPEEM